MCIQRGSVSYARAIPDEEHEDRTAEFIRKIHLNKITQKHKHNEKSICNPYGTRNAQLW